MPTQICFFYRFTLHIFAKVMGQINLPMSNKNGTSTFWKSMWDSKHEYTQNLHDCFGLTMLLKAALHKYFIFQPQFSINLRRTLLNQNFSKSAVGVSTVKSLLKISSDADVQNELDQSDDNFINEQFFFALQACRGGVISHTRIIPFFAVNSWILKFKAWIVIFVDIYVPRSKKSRFDLLLEGGKKKKTKGFATKKSTKFFINGRKKSVGKLVKKTKFFFFKKFFNFIVDKNTYVLN